MEPRPQGRSLGLVETRGFTAAVEAAVAAGSAAASAIGELVRGHVIPSPGLELEDAILSRPSSASR
jgi:microcompartment protein CcmL/EutN